MRGTLVVVSLVIGCGAQNTLGYLQPPQSSESYLALGDIHNGITRELHREYKRQSEKTPPPISLVPTDGSELELKKLGADVAIDGPVAHTELRFSFHNAEARVREGRFSITLPTGAAVTRFAMRVNGVMREARVVARERGREVYETFLHRKVDPALLEQDMGNVFSARVFPIAAFEDKELILSYDHVVSPAGGYTLALQGMPKIGALAVTVDSNGEKKSFAQMNMEPDDISIEVGRGTDAVGIGEAFV